MKFKIPISLAMLSAFCWVAVSAAEHSRVYAGGYISNNVTVIQPATNTVSTAISVGAQPYSLASSADGERIYVANSSSASVSVISTATDAPIGVIPVASVPFFVAVTRDGRELYVTFNSIDAVGVYDLATKAQVGLISLPGHPYRVVANPRGPRVYVTTSDSTELYVINTASRKLVKTIELGYSGLGLAISPDGSRVYVSTQLSGPLPGPSSSALWAIDTETNQVVDRVDGWFGEALAVSPEGSRIYGGGDFGVATLRAQPLRVMHSYTLPPGSLLHEMAMTASGTRLYLTFPLENAVKVFDVLSNSIVGTIPVGEFPWAIAIPGSR